VLVKSKSKLKGDIARVIAVRPSNSCKQVKISHSRKCLAAILSIAAFFFAHSQSLYASPDRVLEQLTDCANIADNKLRLRCYDGIVEINSADSDVSKQLPKTTEANTVSSEKQQLNTAQLGEKYLEKKISNTQDQTVVLTLKTAYKNKHKLWVFEFTNGQIWRQLERQYIRVPKDSTTSVTISAGVFGSHDLRVGGTGRPIKVKRLK
jgi:hypothetical protein